MTDDDDPESYEARPEWAKAVTGEYFSHPLMVLVIVLTVSINDRLYVYVHLLSKYYCTWCFNTCVEPLECMGEE